MSRLKSIWHTEVNTSTENRYLLVADHLDRDLLSRLTLGKPGYP